MKRSFSEVSKSDLHTAGYQIFRQVIDVPEGILLEAIKRSKSAAPIFNHNEMVKSDKKRRQNNLSEGRVSKAMQDFLRSINKFLKDNVSDTLSPSTWVVLHSKPGCQNQAAHCDYVPNQSLINASDDEMPLGVLVSLMPGSKLNVWPNSIRLVSSCEEDLKEIPAINCQVVHLTPGDILVFRGDLIHAGSSYEKDNYRLHAFMDSDVVPRSPNTTWIIHKHASESLKKIIKPKNTI